MALDPLSNLGTGGRPPQKTSVSESETLPATIETCRIINVNIEEWTVDVVSFEPANRRYFDIQVMSPYFHFANGEGMYVQPEVGALCWVCRPSTGRFAAPFVMGFQSPHDASNDGFQGGRQSLNPGDIMMRTRDENFLILRRGGVVQLGSTPTCQRLFIPIGNFIKDFAENYGLYAFGGELTWTTERTDDTTSADEAYSTFILKAKEKAGNKKHIAQLSIGSHGAKAKTTLLLNVMDTGEDGQKVMVTLDVTKEGNVTWTIKKDYTFTVDGKYTVTAKKDITHATDTDFKVTAKSNITMTADTNATMTGKSKAAVKSDTEAQLDAPKMCLGDGATEPVVLGNKLATLLKNMCTQIAAFTYINTAGSPTPVTAAPGFTALGEQVSSILSSKAFTK